MKSIKLLIAVLMPFMMSCTAYYNSAYNDDIYNSHRNPKQIVRVDAPVKNNNTNNTSSDKVTKNNIDTANGNYDTDYYNYRMGGIERTYTNQGYYDDYYSNSDWRYNFNVGFGYPYGWGWSLGFGNYPFYGSIGWGMPFYGMSPWGFGYYPGFYNPYRYGHNDYYNSYSARQFGSRNNGITSNNGRSPNSRNTNQQKSAVLGGNNIAPNTVRNANVRRTISPNDPNLHMANNGSNVNRAVNGTNRNVNVTRPRQNNITRQLNPANRTSQGNRVNIQRGNNSSNQRGGGNIRNMVQHIVTKATSAPVRGSSGSHSSGGHSSGGSRK